MAVQSGRHLLNRNAAGNQWRNVREAAGLEEFTLHDLRHFCASGLIADGGDVVTVQRSIGHASRASRSTLCPPMAVRRRQDEDRSIGADACGPREPWGVCEDSG
ncbi:tyrosine-type recombinase/integrase [Sinomonas flava]|uniref:Tyr recombinase domain-containing protein n=1 Tax=Sinomonas flava TaxID=496857 RepID=A0ABN3BQ49_9MICC